jgi:pyruvate carboxylase subunit B
MWHALKGTDYTLDIDPDKIIKAEEVFAESFEDYFFPPESRMVSPLIPFSPMPGGALTSNTMMMRDTGTLHLFPQVIKEMSEVVRLGGFGTSVTPVSQFYFQQAYLNVTLGKWEKINPGYGNMVLGYFGSTPVEPDLEIIRLASEQLGKPIFKDDPLDVLEPGMPKAAEVLKKNNLPETEENLFIASSCDTKGIDFLLGKAKSSIRKKTDGAEKEAPISVKSGVTSVSGPRDYTITVDGRAYQVQVNAGGTVATADDSGNTQVSAPIATQTSGIDIPAPTPGNIVRLEVEVGDTIAKEQTLLVMEAMKMESEVKSPQAGTVQAVFVQVGDTVQAGDALLSLGE